jgi:hypothetical protein
MSRTSRGQAALEFLTTYGWAFLIILVMIGAISYFGILNPSKFLPQRCTASAEFSCVDYQLLSASGGVSLQLKQGIGKTIYFENVTCTYNDGASPVTVTGSATLNGQALTAVNNKWPPKDTVTTTCNFGASSAIGALKGQKTKVEYTVNYRLSPPPNGLLHTIAGEVFAQVQ